MKQRIDSEIEQARDKEPIGDGKAVFLSNGTDEEYEDYDKKVNKGWGGFYKRVFNNLDNKHESD